MTHIDRYAVFGNPIAHSKSPIIHQAFAKQFGETISYEKILVPVEGFSSSVLEFQQQGGKGLNVTLPFKEQAWQLVDKHLSMAQRAKAVNTIIINKDGTLTGENTDGIGLVRDLQNNHAISLQGKRILILGAGGAVRSIIPAILDAVPKELMIANRTAAKAQQIAKEFQITGVGLDAIPTGYYDLIINGTSASLQNDLPTLPTDLVQPQTVCYDLAYSDKPTSFQQWAEGQGAAKSLAGLGMLVEQAAEGYFLWRGQRPQTQPVMDMLLQMIKIQ